MGSVRNNESHFFKRLTTGLAAIAAACGIIAIALMADNSSTQADAPWDCNRDGTVCNPF
ncbi:hypothetical protein [Streptomyces sp. NPDC046862]|uniref:hypothetical protein n=1 Tax=Streptomyces sp. NPDC046862 TaxID=3154603 RepID=UPI003452404F